MKLNVIILVLTLLMLIISNILLWIKISNIYSTTSCVHCKNNVLHVDSVTSKYIETNGIQAGTVLAGLVQATGDIQEHRKGEIYTSWCDEQK